MRFLDNTRTFEGHRNTGISALRDRLLSFYRSLAHRPTYILTHATFQIFGHSSRKVSSLPRRKFICLSVEQRLPLCHHTRKLSGVRVALRKRTRHVLWGHVCELWLQCGHGHYAFHCHVCAGQRSAPDVVLHCHHSVVTIGRPCFLPLLPHFVAVSLFRCQV